MYFMSYSDCPTSSREPLSPPYRRHTGLKKFWHNHWQRKTAFRTPCNVKLSLSHPHPAPATSPTYTLTHHKNDDSSLCLTSGGRRMTYSNLAPYPGLDEREHSVSPSTAQLFPSFSWVSWVAAERGVSPGSA